MHILSGFLLITALCTWCALPCLAQSKTKEGVEQAMKTYDRLILGMNADSISMIYAPDGELGTMARGRDSIRNFLNAFKNFRVLSQSSETINIAIDKDSAFQTGTYRQTVIIPSRDTVSVKGNFTALWIWTRTSGWLIGRMETKPVK
jgi:Domain of unknown function (DUF4440)